MTELKPCPFCGAKLVGQKELWRHKKTGVADMYTVYYHPKRGCVLDYKRFHFYNGEELVEAWNRRANDAAD